MQNLPSPAIIQIKLLEFREFVSNTSRPHYHQGVDGSGETRDFICDEALREYWQTNNRISELLDENTGIGPKTLADTWLQVWSILCYIARDNETHFINTFKRLGVDDSNLPVLRWPVNWPKDPATADLQKRFEEHQWRFTPLKLGPKTIYRKALHQRQIIPAREVPLSERGGGGGDDGVVTKADLCPCCIIDRKYPPTVVFKKIGPTEDKNEFDQLEKSWENELDIYAKLENWDPMAVLEIPDMEPSVASPFDYVTQCLGCFEQPGPEGKRWTIILEFAAGGSLNDFYRSPDGRSVISPRLDKSNILPFWNKLLRCLLQGLVAIHAAGR